jgi:magnesium transporter
MTVTCRLYREGHLDRTDVDAGHIGELLEDPKVMLWVDVESPTQQDLAMLGEQFGFHELALEDCLHPHQRPKVEQYETYFFLVAYGVSFTDRKLAAHELSAFVSRRYLVTVRKDPVFDLSEVVARWEAHGELTEEGGGYLLYVLLDEVVDGYFDALDQLEDSTEVIEELVFETPAEQSRRRRETGRDEEESVVDVQSRIFEFKKQLLQFRRWVAPLRDVLDVMQRRTVDVVTPPLEAYYRDVYDHVLRATDFLDSIRDILSSALEAHLAVVSNRLNEIMKSLTSWAAIILIPTLIAGLYGMNFANMPELHWRFGYLYALGVMFGSMFLLYRAFKRRGWL